MGTEKRRLLFNWCEAHGDLRRLHESGEPVEAGAIGNDRGWTYLTFYPRGTRSTEVLYDVNRVRKLAEDNGYYLPHEVVSQYNKIVMAAHADEGNAGSPLTPLYALLTAYAARFADVRRFPRQGFYGKFGGSYERPEKGRVCALYSRDDDSLLAISESLQQLVNESRFPGFRIELGFSNGLSVIPRLLSGFADPEYRQSGATHHRIVDPARFSLLLDQAGRDYARYRFEETGERAAGR